MFFFIIIYKSLIKPTWTSNNRFLYSDHSEACGTEAIRAAVFHHPLKLPLSLFSGLFKLLPVCGLASALPDSIQMQVVVDFFQ